MKRTIQCIRAAAGATVFSFSLIAAADAQAVNTAKAQPAVQQIQKLQPQSTCPVHGGKINKSMYADAKGKRIYVCCGGCIDVIKKDPEKYIKILADRGEGVETIVTSSSEKKAVADTEMKGATTVKDTSVKEMQHGDRSH